MRPELPKRATITVGLVAFFCVILPVLAVLVFYLFAMGGSPALYNLLANPLSAMLLLSIPVGGSVLAMQLVRRKPLNRARAVTVGFSAVILAVHAIAYLPLVPVAIILIAVFGVGLLPLAPLLGLIMTLHGLRQLDQCTQTRGASVWPGALLALGVIIAIDMPAAVTHAAMYTDSMRVLRTAGSADYLEATCSERAGSKTGIIASFARSAMHIDPARACEFYFLATGEVPERAAPAREDTGDSDRGVFDAFQGGDKVGLRSNDVVMTQSDMAGSVDATGALSYLEWTMLFHNSSPFTQEGRADIKLPAGAVVSRATLWINGEEREAAFGGRSKVRKAYEAVVKQQRDPLLVTTSGPDRVLVQFFPIMPGADMRIRIGITAPMKLTSLATASLALPSFGDHNFAFSEKLAHTVRVTSDTPFLPHAALRIESAVAGEHMLRGEIPQGAFPLAAIRSQRPPAVTAAWSEDPKNARHSIIVQQISERNVAQPVRLAIVVDGSVSMKDARPELVRQLANLRTEAQVALFVATDTGARMLLRRADDPLNIGHMISNEAFSGGVDNSAAVAAAWDWAAQGGAGAIVWLHGPQPGTAVPLTGLRERFERHARTVELFDMEVKAGPNAIARQLEGLGAVHAVERQGELAADMARLFSRTAPDAKEFVITRTRQKVEPMDYGHKTSDHLARLWASDLVAAAANRPEMTPQATALATSYQLVTAVSGAVVLETQAEYNANGLSPVAPGSVPSIPEPETWLLIIVVMAVMAWRIRQRRRA